MTRPMTRRVAALPVVATLALALSACGGPGDAPDAEEELGPLDAYFEQIYGEWDEETGNAQMVEVEERIAACMLEQGFEYTPVDPGDMGGTVTVAAEDEIPWGTEEFAQEYGYGITVYPGQEELEEPSPEELGEEWFDPNQEYVESMTDGERDAYYAALYGEGTMDVDMDEEYEYDWRTAGCQGRASHEVYEETGLGEEQTAALQADMEAMWEATMADPRITEVEAEWAACMADAGFGGYSRVGDPETQLSEKVNAVHEEVWAEPTDDMTEEGWLALEKEIEERIAQYTTEEIETAVADFGCREEVDYDGVSRAVTLDHQQTFVDTHRAELEAWVEAATADRS